MTTLYHYCSNAAFLSIVSTHKIFASEFTLSNDLLEGKWIREVVNRYIEDKKLDFFHGPPLSKQLDILIDFIGGAGVCLSEEGDLLSQWRAYSDDACGISIGFDSDCFGVEGSALPSLQRVIYDQDVQKSLIERDLDHAVTLIKSGAGRPIGLLEQSTEEERERLNRDLLAAVFKLFPHLYIFKNPAFKEEREWRSVTIVVDSQLTEASADNKADWFLGRMDFRALSDRIVPYREFSLDNSLNKSAIRDVVLGPRNITPPRIIEACLRRHGWRDVSVRRSSASYR